MTRAPARQGMSDLPEVAFDVFISYAEADRAWVEGFLLDALNQSGVRSTTEAGFRLGVPRLLEFERAVKSSRFTLLILSPAYLADDRARFIDVLSQSYGLETSTWPVLPVVLQPVTLPTRLAMLQSLDATDPAEQGAVIGRLCAELDRPAPAPEPERPSCPYPGMVPFQEADRARFFGREAEVEQLLETLRLGSFLTVIGPSGSGKSSLVFAGLLPALRKSALFGPGDWLVRTLRPLNQPVQELARALGGDPADPSRAVALLFETNPNARRLLLVVDQLEEAFGTDCVGSDAFQQALLALRQVPNVFLVLTARADFYPDLMTSKLWPEIRARRFEVLPLDDDGLRAAVVKPSEGVGVYVEGALVERLVGDAAGEPGSLPLIQETLVLLWERLERRFLPLRAYEAIVMPRASYDTDLPGRTGLQVAMARRADEALNALPPECVGLARRVFLRLVQFGEGRADTRRQQTLADLRSTGDARGLLERTLRHFAERRLLTLGGAETSTLKVDIAHEALIGGWPRLRQWIKERREAELVRRRLEAKAEEWVRLGRGNGGLLDEDELPEAERWLTGSDAAELGYASDLDGLVRLSRARLTFLRDRDRRFWRGIVAGLSAVVVVVVSLALVAMNALSQKKYAEAARAEALADDLLADSPQAVAEIIKSVRLVPAALDRLRDPRIRASLKVPQKVRASVALLEKYPIEEEFLNRILLSTESAAGELSLIVWALAPHSERYLPELWKAAGDPKADPNVQLRAAAALAEYVPGDDPRWAKVAALTAPHILSADPLELGTWTEAFRHARRHLMGPLVAAFRLKEPNARQVAATILSDYAADRPDIVIDLLKDADARQFALLFPDDLAGRERLREPMREELKKTPEPDATAARLDALAGRHANALLTLARLDEIDPLWPSLERSPDPRLQTYLIQRLGPFGIDSHVLMKRLTVEADASVKAALVLALHGYPAATLPDDLLRSITSRLLDDYRRDPDPGVHSAVHRLLDRWKLTPQLDAADAELASAGPEGGRRWYVNRQGQTLAVVADPQEFTMGSPDGELGRNKAERLHRRRIGRTYAIATREVTVDDFRKFLKDQRDPKVVDYASDDQKLYSPAGNGPILSVTWFQAAQYCRWLGERERIHPDQMCYPPIPEIGDPMKPYSDYLARTGYRLPTEAEWEYACRAGSSTPWSFGSDETLLSSYARYLMNSRGRDHAQAGPTGALLPNAFGLFDMHGNVLEWCHDRYYKYPITPEPQGDPAQGDTVIRDQEPRIFRGGAFNDLALGTRSAYRNTTHPRTNDGSIGFRVARTLQTH